MDVRDSNGTVLADGDNVILVKDLKVKGSGGVTLKRGTLIKGIRLTDDPAEIECRAEKVRDLVGSTSEIHYIPYDEAYEEGFEDMQRRIPDISKIHDAIGWAPKRTLDQIIDDVKSDQLQGSGVHLIAA